MASLRQLRQSTFNEVDWALGERHSHNQQLLSDARNTTGPPRVAVRSDQARQLQQQQQQHQQPSQFASLPPHTMHEPQDLQARDALRMMAYQDYQRELQASTQQPTLAIGSQMRNNNDTGHRRVRSSATNNNAPSTTRSGRSHASRSPAAGDDDYEALLQLDDNNVSRGITEETQRRVLLRAADWDGIQEVAKRHKVKVDGDSSSTCVICQERTDGTQCRAGGRGSSAVNAKKNTTTGLSLMPCGHVFHTQCLTPWLLQDRRCPTCRKECYHKATVPL